MPITTFLMESEINGKVDNAEINILLNDVNSIFCRKQFVVTQHVKEVSWFFLKKKVIYYNLYSYVGGMGDWQVMILGPLNEEGYSETAITAFLFGFLAGHHRAKYNR